MLEVVEALWFIVKLACGIATISMFTTYCVAVVCKHLKWSPVNLTVNIYRDDQ